MKIRRRWLWVPLLALYVLVMLFGGCADKLLLMPSTLPVPAEGLSRHTLAPNGKTIELWIAAMTDRPPEARVLAFVGNASRAEYEAEWNAGLFGDRPVEVWAMNYPGYGGSEGPARLDAIGPAALAAYDDLAKQFPSEPILVWGNSIGSTAALHVAAHRPVAGVVLQNPPPLQNLILTKFGWWNLWLIAGPVAMQIPDELNALKSAERCTAPAIIISHTADGVVPPKYHQKVIDAYAGPKTVIQSVGSGHNDPITRVAGDELAAQLGRMIDGAGVSRQKGPSGDSSTGPTKPSTAPGDPK